MHAIVSFFLHLFRSLVRGERGWPEMDTAPRMEEQRDHIDARGYLSCCSCVRPSGTQRNAWCAFSEPAKEVVFRTTSTAGKDSSNLREKQTSAPAKVTKITIHGLPVTMIDVSGEYSGMGGPIATATVRVSGYRLLGAIIESPSGNVFIKFAGPANTMAANQPKFRQLLDSFAKAGK